MTGRGACLGSQEARASLQLVLGTRTQGLDREVHDHHSSSTPEERVLEGSIPRMPRTEPSRALEIKSEACSSSGSSAASKSTVSCASLPGSRLAGMPFILNRGLSDPPGGPQPGRLHLAKGVLLYQRRQGWWYLGHHPFPLCQRPGEVELPELTELLRWFLRGAAVWGILGPTVLGLSRFQQHLVHQLFDRE